MSSAKKVGRPRKNANPVKIDATVAVGADSAEPTTSKMDQVDYESQQPNEGFELSKCTYQSDNYVVEYKLNREVINFLMTNSIYSLNSPRRDIVFEPIPITWESLIVSNNISSSTRITDVLKLLKLNLDLNTIITAVETSLSDLEIIEKLGENTYGFVKYVLVSNNMMIKPYTLLSSQDILTIPEKNQKGDQVGLTTKPTQAEINGAVLQYKLIHTPLKEDSFKDGNTFYLYHGTKFENAFSIMRNGVKIGSKSKYFMNGAAYGDGIYLSNDINMSLGYSNMSLGNQSIHSKESINMVLFIFEVKKNPAKNNWLKSGNIFVVDDEDALILRFMMYFNNNTNALNQAIFSAINKKLNAGAIQVQEKTIMEVEKRNITTIHNKRLMREFSIIKKQDPQMLGFNVLLTEEDNLKQWTIELFRVDNPKLEAQMLKLGIKHVEIEITFKENYPIEPPFIRVVHPHFKFRSGHITTGGSLCMEMLTNQGWSPTFNVENIITQIKLAISDGNGEIDEAHWNTRYTRAEAVEAFKRVLATHGWV